MGGYVGPPATGGSTSTGGSIASSLGGYVGSGGTESGGATGGAAGGRSGAQPTFAAVAALMGTNCGTGTCHDGTAHVDLRNNSGLYARLVGGMPNGSATMTACKSDTLVVPGDPTASIISRIVKSAVTTCAISRQPDDCSTTSANPRPCLTTSQISTIDGWIADGAPM